jgi:hypothetical protein
MTEVVFLWNSGGLLAEECLTGDAGMLIYTTMLIKTTRFTLIELNCNLYPLGGLP